CGGYDGTVPSNAYHSFKTCDVYNLTTNAVSPTAAMWQNRAEFTIDITLQPGYLQLPTAVGGYNGQGAAASSYELYSESGPSWTQFSGSGQPTIPVPARWAHASFVEGAALFMIGGYNYVNGFQSAVN